MLLHISATRLLADSFRASEKLYFPAFPSFSHINLRIRKPMLYPLSYEALLGFRAFRCGHAVFSAQLQHTKWRRVLH